MSALHLDLLAGHAGYIASAFGMAFLLIGAELILLRVRRRNSLRARSHR
jgi:hypothetical protein